MPVTETDGARRQLDTLAGLHPEWGAWLALWAEVLDALGDPAWDDVALEPAAGRSPVAPLLTGAVVALPVGLADDWLRRLLTTAGRTGGDHAPVLAAAAFGTLDATALLEAAICQDVPRLDGLAAAAGVGVEPLGAVGQAAAVPLLQTCRRRLASQVPRTWAEGCCPICGAWPALAESRGLERARRLRCSRCGADWGMVAYRCPYCATAEGAKLAALVSEADGEARRVETCSVCLGYVKSVATLRAWAPEEVALADLATVELDLAAIERGYARSVAPALDLGLRVIERTGREPAVGEQAP